MNYLLASTILMNLFKKEEIVGDLEEVNHGDILT